MRILSLIFFVTSILYLLKVDDLLELPDYTFSKHFKLYVRSAWRELSVLKYNHIPTPVDVTFASSLSTIDIVAGVVCICVTLLNQLVWLFAEMFVYGPLPLTLWLSTRNFEKFVMQLVRDDEDDFLENCREKAWFQALHKYKELRCFSDSLNSVWSLYVILWILDSGLTICAIIKSSLESQNGLTIIFSMSLGFLLTTALIVCAEVCRKVSCPFFIIHSYMF
ncbi:unnamed protein product [Orchesella dallaii]|uniref:Uncharacterized protein n=1 Tax=Orchesella dallaii TaxID=48710 RepID=A0ABP1RTA3_9HEXA